MQGNLFSLSSPEDGGTSRPPRGSRDSASRNRFSVGPFSLIAAPCSSSIASESEWERTGGAGIGEEVQGERRERGDLGAPSWGENTPLVLEVPSLTSMPSTCRVFSSRCSCTGKDVSRRWSVWWCVQTGVEICCMTAKLTSGCSSSFFKTREMMHLSLVNDLQ